jgi:hypothetical protein
MTPGVTRVPPCASALRAVAAAGGPEPARGRHQPPGPPPRARVEPGVPVPGGGPHHAGQGGPAGRGEQAGRPSGRQPGQGRAGGGDLWWGKACAPVVRAAALETPVRRGEARGFCRSCACRVCCTDLAGCRGALPCLLGRQVLELVVQDSHLTGRTEVGTATLRLADVLAAQRTAVSEGEGRGRAVVGGCTGPLRRSGEPYHPAASPPVMRCGDCCSWGWSALTSLRARGPAGGRQAVHVGAAAAARALVHHQPP